jgi:hypothetical protein
MGCAVDWYTPDRNAVQIELSDPVTWDLFHEGIRQVHTLIKAETHPVDIVIFAHTALPRGNVLAQFRTAFKNQPPNTGRVIIITPKNSPLLSFIMRIGKIMNEIYPTKSKVVFVHSQAEADALLSASIKAAS